MFRKILLIFLFCGLTVLSLVLEYRASVETYTCPEFSRGLCVPDVKPPECQPLDCDVERPLPRSCDRAWQKLLIGDTIRCPQSLCFLFRHDKLNTVARVSTLDIMRAMGR